MEKYYIVIETKFLLKNKLINLSWKCYGVAVLIGHMSYETSLGVAKSIFQITLTVFQTSSGI